jgi:hypothetical protein
MTATGSAAGDAGEQPGRRQTVTERYHELAMVTASRQPATAEHAAVLTRNAKGDVQIELTVRSPHLGTLELEVTSTFDRLCAKYPRGDSPAGGDRREVEQ